MQEVKFVHRYPSASSQILNCSQSGTSLPEHCDGHVHPTFAIQAVPGIDADPVRLHG